MRKQHKKILVYLLTGILLFSALVLSPVTKMNAEAAPQNINKKACWISFLDMEVLLQDKNETEFRTKVSAMYDNVVKYGMNTVIVHVRAMGDAMYPSNY